MSVTLPACTTLGLALERGCLTITLNRPAVKNAMSRLMVDELQAVFSAIAPDRAVRFVVLRGAEGNFCAGGDIKDMAGAGEPVNGQDPIAEINRAFGHLITTVDRAPQVTIAVLEGAVLGGGFGLACVSDIALALADAKFGLPETSLGLPPAQIAPFVVERIGLTKTRYLALTGARFDGRRALELGLVHELAEDGAALEAKLGEILKQANLTAPGANAVTKQILRDLAPLPLEQRLDQAAELFAQSLRGAEGRAGALAFMTRKPAPWVQP